MDLWVPRKKSRAPTDENWTALFLWPQHFAKLGLAAVMFDYRYWGGSGGKVSNLGRLSRLRFHLTPSFFSFSAPVRRRHCITARRLQECPRLGQTSTWVRSRRGNSFRFVFRDWPCNLFGSKRSSNRCCDRCQSDVKSHQVNERSYRSQQRSSGSNGKSGLALKFRKQNFGLPANLRQAGS